MELEGRHAMAEERTPLYWEVYEHLLDADLSPRAKALVEAAFDGLAAVESALADGVAPSPARREAPPRQAPVRTWLSNLEVTGFRGVGATVGVEFAPGPGLTLVVGRNGSGKSSLSEALELVLTGRNERWAARTKEWQTGWRNLHYAGPGSVKVTFSTEGSRPTQVERRWGADAAELREATTVVTRDGRPIEDGLAGLGWGGALTTHRPLLSYAELGAMFDGPSKLHDALKLILGVDELGDVGEHLAAARKPREKLAGEAKSDVAGLIAQCEDAGDPRALACRDALAAKKRDLDAIGGLLVSGEAADPGLPALRALAQVQGPALDALRAAAAELRAATEAQAALAGTQATRQRALAELLEHALAWHAESGAEECPVCNSGRLDGDWRERARAAAEASRVGAREADLVARRARDAMERAGGLVRSVPAAIGEAEALGLGAEARVAWEAWARRPEAPLALADHLEGEGARLVEALGALRARAADALAARESRWLPLAAQLAGWYARAVAAERAAGAVKDLKAAEKWVKETEAAIRKERFEPIEKQAQAIWADLRQDSNVSLAGVSLEGNTTNRRVEIAVQVDGSAAGALGVMSQGELNALALSLFIPRLTHEASPFHFLIIDDPVQAMDPYKVDGLARVLERTARERQVVVLTHDTRLSEALRRMQIPAHVLEVSRRAQSVVEVRKTRTPVLQYLEDARALTKSAAPRAVKDRVVPALCRSAVEAALTEVVRRRRLGRGERHEAVEETLERARRTTALAALAFFDDEERGMGVYEEINRRFGRERGDAFRAIKEGTHGGFEGEHDRLCADVRQLADGVLALR